MAVKKGGLGKGLDLLFDENATDNTGVVTLNINDIEPNRNQPRKEFDEQALNELADSIEKYGLIQPIVVKPNLDGTYMIIAGERRWRACRIAGIDEVPVIIKETDNKSVMELALVENLQREDLNPIEEALGYKSLIDDFGLTQEEIANRMGKSRSAVTNTLRLLSLNDAETESLRKNFISAGHARALLTCEDEDLREKLLDYAINGASVREIERLANLEKNSGKKTKKNQNKPNFYSEVELSLKNELRRKVSIKPTGKEKGTITIEFYSDKELQEFARKLAGE